MSAPHSVPATLGGGISPSVIRGREAGWIEKRHLVAFRKLSERWRESKGSEFIDFGTDYSYPFYDGFGPTEAALAALSADAKTARHYPSSYGTRALRQEFVSFMRHQFGVLLDADAQVMVTTGASQVFDALSRSYAGRYVLLPDLALSTVNSISVGNGAEIIRVVLDGAGRPDIAAVERIVSDVGADNIRFLYINSPMNPNGVVLDTQYLEQLVALARAERFVILHDNDSWFTSHDGTRAPNVLEVSGSSDVAVSVLSVSKELGLPGLRVGMLAGCAEVINTIRIHNSEFCVMIPEFAQAAATAALRYSSDPVLRVRVQERITASLTAARDGLRSLGWPDSAIVMPAAGYKFMFSAPENFSDYLVDDISGVELFDYLLGRDAGLKLSTSRSFNSSNHSAMRMVLMQDASRVEEAISRMRAAGIAYDMSIPAYLHKEFAAFVDSLHFWEL